MTTIPREEASTTSSSQTTTIGTSLEKSSSPLTATTTAATATATATTKQKTPQRWILCKHWARSKTCLYHAKGKCKFDHPPGYEVPPPTQQQQHRKHHQAQGGNRKSNNQTDLTHRHRSVGGRLQTRNDARVAILRAFLADELSRNGIPDLSSFRVLDVAGGKGELAFQLLNLNNVERCHVIDPRPLSLGRFQKRLSRGFYHRSQGILQTDVVRPQTEEERPVDQLRCFFSSELWEEEKDGSDGDEEQKKDNDNDKGDGGKESNDENNNNKTDHYREQREKFFENCYKAKGWVWPPVGSINEHISCGKNYEDRDDAPRKNTKAKTQKAPTTAQPQDDHLQTAGAALEAAQLLLLQDSSKAKAEESSASLGIAFEDASAIVRTADLIVGMHPDQAVDAIVDAALYQNISFFVVPCCTYSREFPWRMIRVPVAAAAAAAASNRNNNINSNNNNNNEDNDSATRETTPSTAVTTTMKLVTTYEELIKYLQAKSPDIQKHVLPFEGRNICLYRVVPPQKPLLAGKGD